MILKQPTLISAEQFGLDNFNLTKMSDLCSFKCIVNLTVENITAFTFT